MSQFALDLAKFAEKAGNNANLVVRKVSLDILSKVVLRSPVDTGRFRANWVMTIGAESKSRTELLDKTGSATVAREGAKLATYEVGPSIFIMNSLPYAIRLENGYSQQAPVGMVKITVAEFQNLVDDAAKEVAK